MGIFQRKQESESDDNVLNFFDDYFREDLRKRGRDYYEKILDDNGTLFKKDLDATIQEVNVALKETVVQQVGNTIAKANAEVMRRLDEQSAEYGKAMQEAQAEALKSLDKSAADLQKQHQDLNQKIEKTIIDQEALMAKALGENMAHASTMQTAHDAMLASLEQSAQALEAKHKQLDEMLEQSAAAQKAMLAEVFEKNLARVVEHYLLEALTEQYDVKAQLPAILAQLEANKQAIVDDMKL